MLAILIALSAQAVAPPATVEDRNLIVVTAKLGDLRAAVDRCAASKGVCTAREDIIASVRYAEGLFRRGDYLESRRVLDKSIGRNRSAAATDPIAVSQLYEAKSTVASHYGDLIEAQSALGASARVLRDSLPDSTATFNAEIRLLDFKARFDPIYAMGGYQIFAGKARRANRPALALAADLKRGWLLHQRREEGKAVALLEQVAASAEPKADSVRLAARILLARFAREQGDERATDRLFAAIAQQAPGAEPVLIFTPPMPKPFDPNALSPFDMVSRDTFLQGSMRLQWVDIGFWIRPDGTIDMPEVLRGSRDTSWSKPLVDMLQKRRYAGLGESEDGQGRYRVERYTLTADFAVPAGSLVRRRGINPRFEQLDLTEAPPVEKPAPGAS